MKIIEELYDYLKESYGYKTNPAYADAISGVINSRYRGKFTFYLRWQPKSPTWHDDTLVIARIEFQKQRQGHGTRFLQFISNRARTYGYKRL